jgi:hypothetical protein
VTPVDPFFKDNSQGIQKLPLNKELSDMDTTTIGKVSGEFFVTLRLNLLVCDLNI